MKQGSLYTVNDGQLEIVKYINASKVLVRFTLTGYERYARAGDIRNKKVKDHSKPTVYGVGYLGKGKFKANSKYYKSQAYTAWHNMVQRCYSKTYHKTYPYWKDCTVCKDWHNFQNFAVWFEENHVEGFDLDKDHLVIGNRVYSEMTCIFVSTKVNRSTQDSPNRKENKRCINTPSPTLTC